MSEPTREQVERFKRVIKLFEDWQKTLKKSVEVNDDLAAAIGDDQEGLVAAISDLTDEVRELRQDLRDTASAGGLSGLFTAVLRRRRRG